MQTKHNSRSSLHLVSEHLDPTMDWQQKTPKISNKLALQMSQIAESMKTLVNAQASILESQASILEGLSEILSQLNNLIETVEIESQELVKCLGNNKNK